MAETCAANVIWLLLLFGTKISFKHLLIIITKKKYSKLKIDRRFIFHSYKMLHQPNQYKKTICYAQHEMRAQIHIDNHFCLYNSSKNAAEQNPKIRLGRKTFSERLFPFFSYFSFVNYWYHLSPASGSPWAYQSACDFVRYFFALVIFVSIVLCFSCESVNIQRA